MGYRLSILILILIITVAFVRIILLLIRIKRGAGKAKEEYPSKKAESLSVMVDDVLVHYEPSFPEFGRILRAVLDRHPLDELLSQYEISDGFMKLSVLAEKGKRATVGKAAMGKDVGLSPEDGREAKAAMLRIVRALHDIEGIDKSLGDYFKKLVDDFLDVMG